LAEQSGGVVYERRGLSIGPWLTYVRALLAQSVNQLSATDTLPKEECVFYFELGGPKPVLRERDEAESVELDEYFLAELAKVAEGGKVDILLKDEACIDLKFDVPPGLLPEVSQMIEAEILYRSPFAEGVALSIWEAHEAPNGGWSVTAAVTMEAPVLSLVETLGKYGLGISSIIRESGGQKLRSAPPWVRKERAPTVSFWSLFKALNPTLQATLAGALLFAFAAGLNWGHATWRDSALSDAAASAQADLRSTAAEAARLRGLDASLSQSTEVLALTGILSGVLPDDVWLDQIVIDGTEVTLVGFAPSAAEVTRILTDVETLTDIKFASPVIRDNTQGIERFRIAAVFAGGPAR